jgi:hypothetical protein
VLKGRDGGAGELHGIMAKLWEGLSWIGRGCGGLPTVSRARRRRRTSGDSGFEARYEIRVQERAKWREREPPKFLNQQGRVGEACTGASHDDGEVAAGQRSGRGRATWSAREKVRGEELGRRPAKRRRVGATRAGGGTGRAAVVGSGGGLRREAAAGGSGSGVARSGKASRKEAKQWASSGATREGQERQGGLGRHGTAASGGAAARQKENRGRRRRGGGAPGAEL